jgi:hypothetical protein
VDGTPIEGKILDADEARQIYEDIVRRRRNPALLEYVGRGAVQARVFPIPPGGSRKIELEYSEVLPVDNGLVRYVYPHGERSQEDGVGQARVAEPFGGSQPFDLDHVVGTGVDSGQDFLVRWIDCIPHRDRHWRDALMVDEQGK